MYYYLSVLLPFCIITTIVVLFCKTRPEVLYVCVTSFSGDAHFYTTPSGCWIGSSLSSGLIYQPGYRLNTAVPPQQVNEPEISEPGAETPADRTPWLLTFISSPVYQKVNDNIQLHWTVDVKCKSASRSNSSAAVQCRSSSVNVLNVASQCVDVLTPLTDQRVVILCLLKNKSLAKKMNQKKKLNCVLINTYF